MRTIAIIAALLCVQPAFSQGPCPCPIGGECTCGFYYGSKGECKCGDKCSCKNCLGKVSKLMDMHDYEAACKAAVAFNQPLFVGIGCEPPAGYYQTYRLSVAERRQFFKGEKPGIIVAIPDGKGWLEWGPTLPSTATNSDLNTELRKWMDRRKKAQPTTVISNGGAIYYQESPQMRRAYAAPAQSRSC